MRRQVTIHADTSTAAALGALGVGGLELLQKIRRRRERQARCVQALDRIVVGLALPFTGCGNPSPAARDASPAAASSWLAAGAAPVSSSSAVSAAAPQVGNVVAAVAFHCNQISALSCDVATG